MFSNKIVTICNKAFTSKIKQIKQIKSFKPFPVQKRFFGGGHETPEESLGLLFENTQNFLIIF